MIKLSPAALDLQALKNTDGSPPRSAVLLELKLSGKTVAGLVLEAAFRTKRGELLLLTTDDTPFEEVLNIQLLDSGLNLLDSAVMGSAYSTGSFKLVRIEYPNGVRFRFIGDTDWTVEVLAASRSAFPGGADARGVSRPLGITKTVHRLRQSEAAGVVRSQGVPKLRSFGRYQRLRWLGALTQTGRVQEYWAKVVLAVVGLALTKICMGSKSSFWPTEL